MLTIDIAADQNDFIVEVELEGKVYFLGLSWNSACERWTMSIEDANNAILRTGIGLVSNTPLLRWVRSPALPPGDMLVYKDVDSPILRDDFTSGRAILIYATAAEVTQAA